MTEKTSRVSMLWPVSLKEKVRDRVGSRGLTDFTIEAVEAKLGIHDAHRADSKELNEVKDFAQRLADALALGSDYEDPLETLRLLQPPSWLQTIGWPAELAAVVKPEDSTPEPVDPEPEHSQHEPERPVEDVELPAIGDPETILATPPAVKTDDLLERIRSKAAEKGVDLSGVHLKAASTIEAPEPDSAESAQSAEPEPAPPAPEAESKPIAKPMANPNVCQECGGELVNGECWGCF